MGCRIAELRDKQVVCVKDGTILGYVNDVELDVDNGSLISLIVFTQSKSFFSLRREDLIIPWNKIEVIGQDTILVNWDAPEFIKTPIKINGIFGGE